MYNRDQDSIKRPESGDQDVAHIYAQGANRSSVATHVSLAPPIR